MQNKMLQRENYSKLIDTISRKRDIRDTDETDLKRPTVCLYLKRLAENGDIVMDEHHCIPLTEQGLQKMLAPSNTASSQKPIPH